MDDTRFDDTLFEILKDCKILPTFLDAIFGFLSRRTDFYVVAEGPNVPVGLPEGLAERLVRDKFHSWKPKEIVIDENVPEAVTETVVETSSIEDLTTALDTATFCKRKEDIDEFSPSESYNGAKYQNYSWSQTINEVDVIVKVPADVTIKNLSVVISPQSISVRLKTDDLPILAGDLCQKCKHLDAIWSLDKSRLEIHLEKVTEMWWDCLLQSESKLDVSKIDCSRPFEDFSEEVQVKIQELTWNQERKRLGLPTSDDMKMQETLRRAWNAGGSPFKGPFDPNAVAFN